MTFSKDDASGMSPEMQLTELAALAELQQQLDATRLELQELTYTVSHDLRAPLRHIIAYVQVITEDWPDVPPDVAAHLNTIRQSAQWLSRQLEGLTQLSRLGQQVLQFQAMDINVMVQEVIGTIMTNHPTRHVQWLIAKDIPLIQTDAALLRVALSNLLGNAVKFSQGRSLARITLTWQVSDNPAQCQISVRDNGVGFASTQTKALFKVFGKLHPAREFEGLGMGLVCSRKIMERLGGSISIEGVVDQGCCVTICLPLATRVTRPSDRFGSDSDSCQK